MAKPLTLRTLRAALNAAKPEEKHPLAAVAKARAGLERCPGDFWETRLRNAIDRAESIDVARIAARSMVEDRAEEIAALFGVTAARFAERIETRAAEVLAEDPTADEAEIWRRLLWSLLGSVDSKIAADAPSEPTIGDAAIVAGAFIASPSAETLLQLADIAHEARAPGAAWGRIAKLVRAAPKGAPIVVATPPYAIDVRWPRARYRFSAGHVDELLGITSGA